MSLKDKAYAIIKDRIVNCYYPPGSFLSEREIIDELGLSRTPFREAANILCQENLVEIISHKGMFVTGITLKDVVDLYCIRERLELLALELALENIPDDVLELHYNIAKAALQDTSEAQKIAVRDAVQEDEELHKMLLRYSNNALLVRTMEGIYDHNHRIRVISTEQPGIIQVTKEQHFAIISCMHSKDRKAALDAMREHITSSKDRALQTILGSVSMINIKL